MCYERWALHAVIKRQYIYTVYLQGMRVKFVHDGYWVTVKVTRARTVQKPYIRNAKLRSAIIPVL